MRDARRLFFLGFLTLFLELVFIRFLAGNIWNLGYFPNLILVSVFIGMGIGFVGHGFLDERRSAKVFVIAAWVVTALLGFVALFRPRVPGFSEDESQFSGELFFTKAPAARETELLPFVICFLGVILVFLCISQRTAKVFRLFPPLRAYTLDISGSICGILAFMAISWLQLPAWSWFALASLLFLGAMGVERPASRWAVVVPLCAAAAIAWSLDRPWLHSSRQGEFHHVRWSPYQKVEHVGLVGAMQFIMVNRIGHQTIFTKEMLSQSFYTAPHRDRESKSDLPPYRRVLIIGSGSGNDTAVALLHGAEKVNSVEIEPVIAEIGKKFHPLHPYDDPRVELTIDDGRAFLTRSRDKFDLIVFALTDSVVKVSPMAQLRLENFLFTEESLRRAYALLAEQGDLVLYNAYRRPWLVQRLKALMVRATGKFPRTIFTDGEVSVLSVRRSADGGPVTDPPPELVTPTDDWPFLYLQERSIPVLYRQVLGGFLALLLLALVVVHRIPQRGIAAVGARAVLWTKLAFLLMGVAFLLLETKSVIQFSLLFGTTWINNSLVFLGILTLVLLANWIAPRIPVRGSLAATFALLILSCLIPLFFPLSALLEIGNPLARFALASLLTFSPIFFANILFSLAFRHQEFPEHLFGWNLFGATLGGAVEYSSMALGYSALAWIVAACYMAVFGCLLLSKSMGTQPSSRNPA